MKEHPLAALRVAIKRTGNLQLLQLLHEAERNVSRGRRAPPPLPPGYRLAVRGNRTPFARKERLSPADYWADGSLRCPFEDIPGETPCAFHEYAGCSQEDFAGDKPIEGGAP